MSRKNTAAKLAAKDRYVEIYESVRVGSLDDLKVEARELLREEMFSYFKLGLIIDRVSEDHSVQSFETWVLLQLKITMRKAAELRTLATAIVAAQLGEADLQGIAVSSALEIRPVLAEGKTYQEQIPGLLDAARKETVRDLRDKVRGVLKRKEKPAKAADFNRTLKALRNTIRAYLERTDSMKWNRLGAAKTMIVALESELSGISITCTFTDVKSGEVLEVETPAGSGVPKPKGSSAKRIKRRAAEISERMDTNTLPFANRVGGGVENA